MNDPDPMTVPSSPLRDVSHVPGAERQLVPSAVRLGFAVAPVHCSPFGLDHECAMPDTADRGGRPRD